MESIYYLHRICFIYYVSFHLIALAAYVLNSMINKVDPQIIKRNWAGDSDVLDVIQQILKVTDEMVGSGLFAKIKKLI